MTRAEQPMGGPEDFAAAERAAADFSDALDAEDPTGDVSYTLEVSSPGLDRALTEPRHWRRAAGRLVKASVRDAKDVTGRVLEADGSGVTFDVDGTKRTVPYDALGAGRVQVEFSRPGARTDDDEEGERS